MTTRKCLYLGFSDSDLIGVEDRIAKEDSKLADTINLLYITAATGLFFRGSKIESRMLKFCQSHATPLSGMAKCELAKFKQPAVTFCLIKIVRPRQCGECHQRTAVDPEVA